MHRKIRILIVDDMPLMREILRALFEAQRDMEVVGEAGTGTEALELAGRHHPDVVILDITIPGLDGCEVAKRLGRSDHRPKIIAHSVHGDIRYVRHMLNLGAAGYVSKDNAPEELIPAIHTVMTGGSFVRSPGWNAKIFEAQSRESADI